MRKSWKPGAIRSAKARHTGRTQDPYLHGLESQMRDEEENYRLDHPDFIGDFAWYRKRNRECPRVFKKLSLEELIQHCASCEECQLAKRRES